MELIWLPESRDDIQRLHQFLAEVNPEAAKRAIRVIQEGTRRLIRTPELGRPMEDDSDRRELFLPFGGNAYVLRYRLDKNLIVIIRVWHGREAR